MSEVTIAEIKKLTKAQNYFRGYFDGKSDVLDNISEEIERFAKNPDFGDLSLGASCGAMKAIEIINKYRAKNEEL